MQEDPFQRFREIYGRSQEGAQLVIEREAIGANVGANGYTTIGQADMLADALGLGAGSLLLDIGTGRGWPGVHLARKAGCKVVCLDVPEQALAAALDRAAKDGIAPRAAGVIASGTQLPFRGRVFDAVSHTDAL